MEQLSESCSVGLRCHIKMPPSNQWLFQRPNIPRFNREGCNKTNRRNCFFNSVSSIRRCGGVCWKRCQRIPSHCPRSTSRGIAVDAHFIRSINSIYDRWEAKILHKGLFGVGWFTHGNRSSNCLIQGEILIILSFSGNIDLHCSTRQWISFSMPWKRV